MRFSNPKSITLITERLVAFDVEINGVATARGDITFEAVLGLPSSEIEAADFAEVERELLENRDIAHLVAERAIARGEADWNAPVSLSTSDYVPGPYKVIPRLLRASLKRLTALQVKGVLGLDGPIDKIAEAQSAVARGDKVGQQSETALSESRDALASDPSCDGLRHALADQLWRVFRRRV